jgi:hypothetical protein
MDRWGRSGCTRQTDRGGIGQSDQARHPQEAYRKGNALEHSDRGGITGLTAAIRQTRDAGPWDRRRGEALITGWETGQLRVWGNRVRKSRSWTDRQRGEGQDIRQAIEGRGSGWVANRWQRLGRDTAEGHGL